MGCGKLVCPQPVAIVMVSRSPRSLWTVARQPFVVANILAIAIEMELSLEDTL